MPVADSFRRANTNPPYSIILTSHGTTGRGFFCTSAFPRSLANPTAGAGGVVGMPRLHQSPMPWILDQPAVGLSWGALRRPVGGVGAASRPMVIVSPNG